MYKLRIDSVLSTAASPIIAVPHQQALVGGASLGDPARCCWTWWRGPVETLQEQRRPCTMPPWAGAGRGGAGTLQRYRRRPGRRRLYTSGGALQDLRAREGERSKERKRKRADRGRGEPCRTAARGEKERERKRGAGRKWERRARSGERGGRDRYAAMWGGRGSGEEEGCGRGGQFQLIRRGNARHCERGLEYDLYRSVLK